MEEIPLVSATSLAKILVDRSTASVNNVLKMINRFSEEVDRK
jgi:hypothetical protein